MLAAGCANELNRGVNEYDRAMYDKNFAHNAEAARQHFRNAIANLLESLKSTGYSEIGEVRMYTILARCYLELYEFDRARDYLKKGKEKFDTLGESRRKLVQGDQVAQAIIEADVKYGEVKKLLDDMPKEPKMARAQLDIAVRKMEEAVNTQKFARDRSGDANIWAFIDLRLLDYHILVADTLVRYEGDDRKSLHQRALSHLYEADSICEKNSSGNILLAEEFFRMKKPIKDKITAVEEAVRGM